MLERIDSHQHHARHRRCIHHLANGNSAREIRVIGFDK
jgi:hypothetical protein